MSTPEKPPSLADTLAHIDAVLDAYYDPTTNTREVDVVTRITSIVDHAAKPCLRCARQALRGSEFCAAHKRIPREMIEDLGPDGVDDEATAEVLRIVQDDFARHEREYLRGGVVTGIPIEHADWEYFGRVTPPAAEPAPERGWLVRALRRLFT